jgi:CBS domain containing-hemolysin-like protein
MNSILLALVFLALALGGVVVRKTYYGIPAKELKRRAAKRDPVAEQLYRAVSYGNSVRTLLWLFIGFTSAVSVVLLARELPVWVSLIIVAPILYIVFSFIPASRLTPLGERLAVYATPVITWLLNYGHPILSRGADAVEKRYVDAHTKLFEREDLLELIERQQKQHDSRFTAEELEIAKRALRFDEHNVSDVMTDRKVIKVVLAGDTLGPILIDELHKSGQDHVLVRESTKGKFVGNLPVKQLGIKTTGKVSDLMQQPVYYLHEDDTLSEALHAFFVTNHPLFLVVNSFEEFVGIVTVENILQQLLGHVPGSDFDQYADITAVAGRYNKAQETAEDPVKTEEEVVE